MATAGETRTGAFGSIAAGWGMARYCVGFATASESLRSVSGDGNGLPTWLPMGVSAYRWPVVPRGLNRSSESAEHTCVAFLDARKSAARAAVVSRCCLHNTRMLRRWRHERQ